MAGIKYFKLLSPRYGDDTTKGCALTGAEVDANFNFLRGYDIEKVQIAEETRLVLKRVNGDVLSVDLGGLVGEGIREDVDRLIGEVSDINNELSAITQTEEEQSSAITSQGTRIYAVEETVGTISATTAELEEKVTEACAMVEGVTGTVETLENVCNDLTASSADYESRIADLENKVQELENTISGMSDNLNRTLNWIGASMTTGNTFEDSTKDVITDFIVGSEYSIVPDYQENPGHMTLRFGHNAQFVSEAQDYEEPNEDDTVDQH